jgi:anti-sigma factor RsiW
MKKECEFFDDKLLEYALGELEAEPELKKKIEEHTGICTDCWKKVDGYKSTAAAAATAMKVELSEDAWELQRKEIIKRATYRVDVPAEIRKFLLNLLTTRKLATGFALFIVLAAGAGAGIKYYNYSKQLQAERTMITKVDMLENIEIIERLDFYKKMSENKALL